MAGLKCSLTLHFHLLSQKLFDAFSSLRFMSCVFQQVPLAGWIQIFGYCAYCEISAGYDADINKRTPGDMGWNPPIFSGNDSETKTRRLNAELTTSYLVVSIAHAKRRHSQLAECYPGDTIVSTNQGSFLSVLQKTLDNIGVSWYGPYKLSTHETSILDLLDPEPPAFKHHLRTCLRHFVLRTNTAYNARLDMQGGATLNYEANVTLLQQRGKKLACQLTFFQQNSLRNILTGAVYIQERLFKANCAASPTCCWCESGEDEDLEHLFWVCPAWQDHRKFMFDN
jgi:hypothetical protein